MLQQDIVKILQIQLYILIVIFLYFMGRSYLYDALVTGTSLTVRFADRELSTATSNTISFYAWYGYYVPNTITRPSHSIIIVKIYNTSYTASKLLVDTTNAGVGTADMTKKMQIS